jgi:hypothetical protein
MDEYDAGKELLASVFKNLHEKTSFLFRSGMDI